MKKFIKADYEFVPGVAGEGYLLIWNLPDKFEVMQFVSIVNITRGEVLYSPANPAKGLAGIRKTTLSSILIKFETATNTHAATDLLQIIYEDDTTEELLEAVLDRLNIIADLACAVGISDDLRVTPTGTVTVGGTLSTVTTVTTVTTLANQTQIGGQPAIDVVKNFYHNSADFINRNVVVS
jgi:hypothetical protein